MVMANKPRVGVFLRQGAGMKSGNMSAELVDLQKRYKEMNANFRKMDKALKQRHQAMIKMDEARNAVAEILTTMSKDTPLEAEVGETYSTAMGEWSEASKSQAEKFKTFALDYVAQWEKTVSTRINTDTKETDKLRREADHYKTKVETLEKQIKQLEEKSKPVPDATMEKLERNQEKLEEANTAYNTAAESLLTLMQEVVDRSWRDLHPLLIKCLKFDLDVHEEEQQVLEPAIKDCVGELLEFASTHDINQDGRLEDIVETSPQDLSTVVGGATASGGDASEEVIKTEEEVEASPEQPLDTSESGENPFDD